MVDWEWEGDPREITRSAVRSVIAVVASNPGIPRALLEGALDNETIEQRWMRSRAVLIERIAELIEQEQRGGRAATSTRCWPRTRWARWPSGSR